VNKVESSEIVAQAAKAELSPLHKAPNAAELLRAKRVLADLEPEDRPLVTEHPVTREACSPEERARVLGCLASGQPWELPKEGPKAEEPKEDKKSGKGKNAAA